MIGKLKGRLDSVDEEGLIVDVGGVGYVVAASARTLRGLPAVGEAVSLHIETQVREDAIRLFGFLTQGERDWFRLLQSVQGVGAKVALGILGALPGDALASAISRQDKAMMARAPGVGPKLAARLVLELKDKAGAVGRRRFRRARGGAARRRAAEAGRRRGAGADGPRLRPPAGGGGGRQGLSRAGGGGGDGGAHPRRPQGTRAVSASAPAPPPRPFFGPAVGLVLLFAALGPAVGGSGVHSVRRCSPRPERRRRRISAGSPGSSATPSR